MRQNECLPVQTSLAQIGATVGQSEFELHVTKMRF